MSSVAWRGTAPRIQPAASAHDAFTFQCSDAGRGGGGGHRCRRRLCTGGWHLLSASERAQHEYCSHAPPVSNTRNGRNLRSTRSSIPFTVAAVLVGGKPPINRIRFWSSSTVGHWRPWNAKPKNRRDLDRARCRSASLPPTSKARCATTRGSGRTPVEVKKTEGTQGVEIAMAHDGQAAAALAAVSDAEPVLFYDNKATDHARAIRCVDRGTHRSRQLYAAGRVFLA